MGVIHSNSRQIPQQNVKQESVQQKIHSFVVQNDEMSEDEESDCNVSSHVQPMSDADLSDNEKDNVLQLSIDKGVFRSAFDELIGIRNQIKDKKKKEQVIVKEKEEMDLSEDFIKRKFKKEDACSLSIVGQFNRGFIIGALRTDIFIIDQHATDEKFRFENLMKNYKMKTQNLLCPQRIPSLTPQQAIAIADNLHIFAQNGFTFDEKLKIKSLPMSINPQSKIAYQFGADDILELASILCKESKFTIGSKLLRPAKVRSIFASRACRGAIMIGKPLTIKEMRVVVDNIRTLDQPWNCPHGRPTMRHLFDLSMLNEKLEQKTKNSNSFNQYGAYAFV